MMASHFKHIAPLSLHSAAGQLLLASAALFAAPPAQAQRDTTLIERDVEVVNTYEPTLRRARKLSVAPLMDDTMNYRPTFRYETLRRETPVATPLQQLKPAPMTFAPYTSPYKWLIEAAAGSQPGFMGQVAYNNAANDRHQVTFRVGHLGMLGKVKLDGGLRGDLAVGKASPAADSGDPKVEAPEQQTWAQANYAYTRHNFRWGAALDVTNDAYRYYGLHGLDESHGDLLPDLKARNTGFVARFHFGNDQAQRTGKFRFSALAQVAFLANREHLKELEMRYGGNLYFPLHSQGAAIDADVYVSHLGDKCDRWGGDAWRDERKITDFDVAPHFVLRRDWMDLKLGVRLRGLFESETNDFIVEPDLNLNFFFGDGRVALSAAVVGGMQRNSFRELLAQCPYISPVMTFYRWDFFQTPALCAPWYNLYVSRQPLLARLAVRARFTQKVQLKVGFEWASLEDYTSFVNNYVDVAEDSDTTRALLPQLAMVQTSGKSVKVDGELSVCPTEHSSIVLAGYWRQRNMDDNAEAFGHPFGEVSLTGKFKPVERLACRASLAYEARRWTYNAATNELSKMKGFLDLNLGASFYISSRWSVFLDLHNVTCADQQRWIGYSSKRFNAFAGMTLKL